MYYFKAILFLTISFYQFFTNARHYDDQFYIRNFFDFIKQYDIDIKDGDEFYYRLSIFANKYDEIEDHNKKDPDTVWGINKFSHLTNEEFKAFVNRGGFKLFESKRYKYKEYENGNKDSMTG